MVAMKKQLFERLVASMEQHGAIIRGEREPARRFRVDAVAVKQIRAITQLSQPKFARILDVDVGTLRNWEQGRREPTGPAKALLRAIRNNPEAVLRALARS
jgi:putative transcriptional regulator